MASQFALHTDVQWPNTSAVPHNFWQNGILTAPCCCAAQADNRLVTLQIHLRRFGLHTGVQWPDTSAVPHCFWQNAIAPCSVPMCNTGRQQACDTANTPMEICSSYRCAVADTRAVPHCCWQIAMVTVQCCCATQADSRPVTLQIQLWRFAPHTGVQWPDTRAVPHCFWQNAIAPCSVPMCNTGRQQACDTANPLKEIWSSYRFAVAQHQCSATRLLAKFRPQSSPYMGQVGGDYS